MPTAWLVGVMAVGLGGLVPDDYRGHVAGLSEPRRYPLFGVMQFVIVLTVETVALWAILRPASYHRSWQRALTALLVFVPITLYFGSGLMHSPTYQYLHFVWSMAVSVALLVALAATAIARSRARRGAG